MLGLHRCVCVCCMCMLHVHAACVCACCMCMLHVYVHAACCMCMLHVACACACTMCNLFCSETSSNTMQVLDKAGCKRLRPGWSLSLSNWSVKRTPTEHPLLASTHCNKDAFLFHFSFEHCQRPSQLKGLTVSKNATVCYIRMYYIHVCTSFTQQWSPSIPTYIHHMHQGPIVWWSTDTLCIRTCT